MSTIQELSQFNNACDEFVSGKYILIDLKIVGVFFKSLVTLIALSLIVIFQPELRRFLGYLGQPGFIKRTFFSSDTFREST